MPSLIQRITADEVMQKRWKLKNENKFFAPYDAGDDKNEDQLQEEYGQYQLERSLALFSRRPIKKKRDKRELVFPQG